MITNINSPENLQLLVPFSSEKEIKDYKLLLGEKGAKKKKPIFDIFKEKALSINRHDDLVTWTTFNFQRFRALTSHSTALKLLKEIGVDKNYVPVIKTDLPWNNAFGKAIDDLSLSEVLLPVPECLLHFKYIDKKDYVAYLHQPTKESKIAYRILPHPDISDEEHKMMMSGMGIFIAYILLSFELKLTALSSSKGENIVFDESNDKPRLNRDYEYKVLPIKQERKESSAAGRGTGSKKKFHIRRAHWRTYEDGKRIRIGWMFVGDINLGFVDKDYVV